MQTKILFNIEIPAVPSKIELWLAKSIQVRDVLPLICQAVDNDTTRVFAPDKETMLYNKETGCNLNLDAYIGDLELKNGTTLLLV